VTESVSAGSSKLGYNRGGQALFVLIPALIGAGLGLWSETAQGLSAGARAVLSMRARALKDKKAADAADLRTELINLGVVVRDEGGKQYCRLANRPDALDA
jgi:cysteinyl-tRNA synthetase